MLEIRNLTKYYHSKKGEDTLALNNVSLKFGDTGLVFILGKSGAGKSTLLNVMGGLDSFEGGEIIINGKSSADFKQSDFDSYRNTYLGFIFQEFNILEGFSVGQNIALAMQLQNRKGLTEEVNAILEQVDLEGYANRRPNELSGGQKQRVAIARALIKDPSVIFADEPTGALDADTGRQVFETLKSLSKDKLVVVVSHDRDFADKYGDRIIEVRDGEVYSDRSKEVIVVSEDEHVEISDDSIIKIEKGKTLTQQHVLAINKLIAKSKDDIYISLSPAEEAAEAFPEKIKYYGKNNRVVKYRNTNENKIVSTREAKPMIKSTLPIMQAMKMAFSNFKAKKFRLVVTLFLSIIALALFGFANILSGYDRDTSYVKTFYEGDSFMMSVEKVNSIDAENLTNVKFMQGDLDFLSEQLGSDIAFLYDIEKFPRDQYDTSPRLADTEVYVYSSHPVFKPSVFTGIIEADASTLPIAYGKYPTGTAECAISDLYAEAFVENGMRMGKEDGTYERIYLDNYEQLIGKEIIVGGKEYTISGVYSTNYYVYKEIFKGKTIQDIEADQELRLKKSDYQEDEAMFMSKILLPKGYADVYKLAINDYNAKMYVSLETDSEVHDSAYIRLDNKYGLAQGEVYISATYYRNMMYGYESTRTFEQLETDFDNKDTFEFYTLIDESGVTDDKSYSKKLKVVGLYDDLFLPGESLVIMNEQDFNMVLDSVFMPTGAMTKGMISGKDMQSLISTMHVNNYEVYARNQESLRAIGNVMTRFISLFYIAAAVLAVFVTLLLYNFISTSISIKRKEIGILRAIGARGIDVISIFAMEGVLLAAIICAISIPLVYIGTNMVNNYMLTVIPVVLVGFNTDLIWIMSGLTLAIILISSFFPVFAIARKKPIEAIQDR